MTDYEGLVKDWIAWKRGEPTDIFGKIGAAFEATRDEILSLRKRLAALEQSTARAERSAPGAQSDADKGASGAYRDGAETGVDDRTLSVDTPTPAVPASAASGGILPCPFCGNRPVLHCEPKPWVECTICEIGSKYCPSEKDAIAIWNRRPRATEATITLSDLAEAVETARANMAAARNVEVPRTDPLPRSTETLSMPLASFAPRAEAGRPITLDSRWAIEQFTFSTDPLDTVSQINLECAENERLYALRLETDNATLRARVKRYEQVVRCEDTDEPPIDGVCPVHRGDACLKSLQSQRDQLKIMFDSSDKLRAELASARAEAEKLKTDLLRAQTSLDDKVKKRIIDDSNTIDDLRAALARSDEVALAAMACWKDDGVIRLHDTRDACLAAAKAQKNTSNEEPRGSVESSVQEPSRGAPEMHHMPAEQRRESQAQTAPWSAQAAQEQASVTPAPSPPREFRMSDANRRALDAISFVWLNAWKAQPSCVDEYEAVVAFVESLITAELAKGSK